MQVKAPVNFITILLIKLKAFHYVFLNPKCVFGSGHWTHPWSSHGAAASPSSTSHQRFQSCMALRSDGLPAVGSLSFLYDTV